MSQKYEKLKSLLKELFQLDQPDLDFGLYRIMHAKSAEVMQFLDKDLLPQVKEAFSLYRTADKVELEKELARTIQQARDLGFADPEQAPRVKELRAKLASDAVDIGALENEVYDHLFSFFRRCYSEGDFLAKRVYKRESSPSASSTARRRSPTGPMMSVRARRSRQRRRT
jgi:adenine-specific DNA-methyltransferase